MNFFLGILLEIQVTGKGDLILHWMTLAWGEINFEDLNPETQNCNSIFFLFKMGSMWIIDISSALLGMVLLSTQLLVRILSSKYYQICIRKTNACALWWL